MTELQATKVNSMIGRRKSADAALSPRQLKLLKQISAVLKKDKTALANLTVPSDSKDWPTYQAKLESKLNAASIAGSKK